MGGEGGVSTPNLSDHVALKGQFTHIIQKNERRVIQEPF